MKKLMLSLLLGSLVFFSSCGDQNKDTTVVDSGTYTGVAETVNADEKEIYVRTDDDKLIELYMTDSTEMMMNGKKVMFDKVEKGQKVKVTVEKKGKKNVPMSVMLMEKDMKKDDMKKDDMKKDDMEDKEMNDKNDNYE